MKTIIKHHSSRIRTWILCISLILVAACSEDFGDINKSWDSKLYQAEVPGLFNQLVSSLQKRGQEYRIETSWLYQYTQLAAMFSSSGYRLDDNVSEPWKNYYRNVANFRELKSLIAENDNAANMTNIESMATILMAYRALKLTLQYGDMPYQNAGKAFISTKDFRPSYDSQQTVMKDAISKIGTAMSALKDDSNQVDLGAYETLLGNDISQWQKFANSLRLRYAVIMQGKDPDFCDPIIADALSKPLLNPEEVVALYPNSTAHDINRGPYFRGNSYMRMGSTIFDAMSSTDAVDGSGIYDLRAPIYFEPNEDDEWIPYPQVPDGTQAAVTDNPNPYAEGRTTGTWDQGRSNYASFNVYYVVDKKIPEIFISGSEVNFLKAEIYNRGLAGVAADPSMAETHYLEGITASVKFWYKTANETDLWTVNKPAAEPTQEELDAMLTNPHVAYSPDQAEALKQIYKQSWLALFHQPFEAWNLQRRTGNATPGVPLPESSVVPIFYRLIYPSSERDSNNQNWKAATNNGTTDMIETKIWIQP